MSQNAVRSLKDESHTASPRRILVPVDTLPGCGTALEHATGLAAALAAELVLLGIAPVADAAPALPDLDGGPLPAVSDEQRLLDGLAQERLDEAAGAVPPSVRPRTVLTWGPAGPAIADAAHDEGADLVVVPMRRESELAHLLHDHTDRHVLHHSPVPVLVVPVA
jgi:nucleotide-binding universal stress UspA family protein